jgi:hypothetical protein
MKELKKERKIADPFPVPHRSYSFRTLFRATLRIGLLSESMTSSYAGNSSRIRFRLFAIAKPCSSAFLLCSWV